MLLNYSWFEISHFPFLLTILPHAALGGRLRPCFRISTYPKVLEFQSSSSRAQYNCGLLVCSASQGPRLISAACFLNCLVGISWANIPSSSLKVRSLNSGTSNQAQIRLRKERAIHTNADLPPKSAGEIKISARAFSWFLGHMTYRCQC